MLSQTSEEFRSLFLLQFTRELIKNSGGAAIFELKGILEEEKKNKTEKIRSVIGENKKTLPKDLDLKKELMTRPRELLRKRISPSIPKS